MLTKRKQSAEYQRQWRAANREHVRERARRYRDANREKIREQDRQREAGEQAKAVRAAYRKANPEGVRERARRSAARYPEKVKARRALTYAVNASQVKRQPCEVCGAEPAHGHHDDYTKPLEVRWLCIVHHAEHHRNERTSKEQMTT